MEILNGDTKVEDYTLSDGPVISSKFLIWVSQLYVTFLTDLDYLWNIIGAVDH